MKTTLIIFSLLGSFYLCASQACSPLEFFDQTLNKCIPCSDVKIGCIKCLPKPEVPGKGICDGCNAGFIFNDPKNLCECTSNQFLDTLGRACKLCTEINSDQQCLTCVESENRGVGQCSSCSQGYGLTKATNKCQKCSAANCANCSFEGQEEKCTSCLSTFGFDLWGKCVSCRTPTVSETLLNDEKCLSCSKNSDAWACNDCEAGYGVGVDKRCYKCSDLNVPKCAKCGSVNGKNQCIGCEQGFYPKDGSCMPCGLNCLKCENDRTCLSCMASTYLIVPSKIDCSTCDASTQQFGYDQYDDKVCGPVASANPNAEISVKISAPVNSNILTLSKLCSPLDNSVEQMRVYYHLTQSPQLLKGDSIALIKRGLGPNSFLKMDSKGDVLGTFMFSEGNKEIPIANGYSSLAWFCENQWGATSKMATREKIYAEGPIPRDPTLLVIKFDAKLKPPELNSVTCALAQLLSLSPDRLVNSAGLTCQTPPVPPKRSLADSSNLPKTYFEVFSVLPSLFALTDRTKTELNSLVFDLPKRFSDLMGPYFPAKLLEASTIQGSYDKNFETLSWHTNPQLIKLSDGNYTLNASISEDALIFVAWANKNQKSPDFLHLVEGTDQDGNYFIGFNSTAVENKTMFSIRSPLLPATGNVRIYLAAQSLNDASKRTAVSSLDLSSAGERIVSTVLLLFIAFLILFM